VDEIEKDPRTGKLQRVKIENSAAPRNVARAVSFTEKETDRCRRYALIMNRKGQYSIASGATKVPDGWQDIAGADSATECGEIVKELTAKGRADSTAPIDIQHLFAEQVKRTPNKAAVACDGEEITYCELAHRAGRLADHLGALGLRENKIIAVCLPRSIDMVVAILGTLKAGGAWLPLDPQEPRDRQRLALKDIGVTALLTHRRFESDLPECGANVISLDNDWLSTEEHPGLENKTLFESTSLAYVMPTSGSTGQPKGVMITRGNLSAYSKAMGQALSVTESDVYLHTAAFSFSSSVRQLMVSLTHGATVVIATIDKIQSPVTLFQLVKDRRVTIMDLVPSYWRNCISILGDLPTPKRNTLLQNRLRLIVTASEPLPTDLPRTWRHELRHGADIINMFGQTETTGIVTTFPLSQNDYPGETTVSIGGAIANTEIFLLDGEYRLVPMGMDGEIFVGGGGIGLGYLDHPELTAAKFVPNPFSPIPGARLYRTGDLARFRPDGEIEFVSRIDDQVKIRGIRIELGEIRSILNQHPAVRQSTVVAASDQTGGKRLIAYVEPKIAEALATADLRNFLRRHLPDYMIPAAFVIMDALPLTSSGKISRNDLPAVDYTAERDFVSPRTPLEETLSAIWAEVLGLERVGVQDDFFDLGGHSLAVGQVISRIADRLDLELPLKSLFDGPTVEEMAMIVAQAQARRAGVENVETMLADLESLSEEEAQRLISSRTSEI
jgi:aspartate racemase